ncbi:zinc metalloprotease HtpX [Allostreptomyces psammosilenae]|uniref:Protease HtpX homolog n=1 Tax=Allostreptomyces psammosilenae TaxID=1892865 RepID=A0A853A8P7_9ACTN|nr:zinc metalloprotease HtpX [Allostreptomyces psammosilenae]NYI07011.1 heat shock protein HtpX [Allostreptomyces psammosilenae]
MARNRFAPDRGLTSRMVLTMFLLGLVYVVFVAVLVVVLRDAWPLALVIAGGLLFVQYFFSDRIALFSMHAREVTPEQAPQLHAIVDRLCALADMPKPRVAIADTDMPNAFATGRNSRRAVVCATSGILRRLEPEELESVLAHELSHVAHRDVAVMTVASFLGVLAGLLTQVGLRIGMFGGFSRDRDSNTGAVLLLVTLVSTVVYAISFLLIRALSRYRELSADRSAALLTGKPSTLAAALTKISGQMARIPTRDLRQAEPFNAFFFTPAVSGGQGLATLFSTHPPLPQRLDQLGRISRELGRY